MLTSTQISRICATIAKSYSSTILHNKGNPLHEAIFILLSAQTDERKYIATWRSFRLAFPTLEAAIQSTSNTIAAAIKAGGLHSWKARRIKNLLCQVKSRYGRLSLAQLSQLPDQELEKELTRLDGIAIKSARCIMMYSYGREVFPVDTHTLRIMRRLGFAIPRSHYRSWKYANSIQAQVPPKLRRRFHINLVQHGRAICSKKPDCNACVLSKLCRTAQKSAARKKPVGSRT